MIERSVVFLTVTLRSVCNDSISVGVCNELRKRLFELGAVLDETVVDDGRRRHLLEDAVAVAGSITITEVSGELNTRGGDVWLVLVLTVEVEDVFDRPEIGVFVRVSSSIFDVGEVELVVTGGGNGGSGFRGRSLEALVTVSVDVFLTTERLISACMGHLVVWSPEVTPRSRESVSTQSRNGFPTRPIY